MNLLTLSLYLSAGAVIGLLTALAFHNRRAGWKKSRTTLVEALEDFYSDLGLSVQPLTAPQPAPSNPSDFSAQLVNLKSALGDATGVAPGSASELGAARQLVSRTL